METILPLFDLVAGVVIDLPNGTAHKTGRTLLECGSIETDSKPKAIQFLKKHLHVIEEALPCYKAEVAEQIRESLSHYGIKN